MRTSKLATKFCGKRIILESDYADKEKIKSLDWDITHRGWIDGAWQVDAKLEVLDLLREIGCEVTEEIEQEIREAEKEKNKKIEESKAVKADIQIPVPNGLAYFPFQKAGIAFANKNGNTLIADEMGLGKTIQAIGVINLDKKINKVLVVCPASLRLNWKKEIEKWLTRNLFVSIASTKNVPDSDIVVINYDIVSKLQKELLRKWDLIILDESHYIKNSKAKRTKATLKIAKKAKKKICLTGTPIKNRPIELFTQVNLLAPKEFSSFWAYAKRYCGAYKHRFGWDLTGATNIDELYKKLRSSCMIRRLKKDVLQELPAKTRQVIEIPANGLMGLIKKEKNAYENWNKIKKQLQELTQKAKESGNEEEYATEVEKLKNGMSVSFGKLAKIRKETAIAKIPLIVEHVRNIAENEKVVVFAHHREVIEKITEELRGFGAVKMYGGISNKSKEKAIQQFQNDKDTKVFVGSLQVAGVGITLTAASKLVFAEIDWTPAVMKQAEDRIHRIGQREKALIQVLVLESSIDAKLIKTIIEKMKIIEETLDRKGGKEHSYKKDNKR